jgi:hypothetical protein
MTGESYYAEVERYFVERRGSPLFITPGEWQLVYEWEQVGVPLHVVKEGIDRVFERPKTRLRPRKLGYCRQTVLAAFRRFREAGMGGGAPRTAASGDEGESLSSRLDEISSRLLRAAGGLDASSARFAAALRTAAERVRELGPALESGELVRVESSLADLDRELISLGEEAVSAERRSELEQQASASLEPYRERMPENVYRAALESAYRRRLRQELDLPVQSLYA